MNWHNATMCSSKLFFFTRYSTPPDLHSFPTRRSSDLDFAIDRRIEPREGGERLPGESGRGIDSLHLGQKLLVGESLDLGQQLAGINPGDRAEFEIEAAILGHDVERRSAADSAGVDRRMGNVEVLIERAIGSHAPCHAA